MTGEAEAIAVFDAGPGRVFQQDGAGEWDETAAISGAVYCESLRRDIRRGGVRPDAHAWPDLVVGDQRLVVSPLGPPCRPVPPDAAKP